MAGEFLFIGIGAILTFMFIGLVGVAVLWSSKRWNIPIVILRYVGNKGRPNMIVTKGRKIIGSGGTKLYVKGYELPVKDFMSENYIPVPKSPYGGLCLWEVDDGILTPSIPKKFNLSPEMQNSVSEAVQLLREQQIVKFEFDEKVYNDIRFKSVDDTSIDWMIDEIVRVKTQYKTGFLNFITTVGPYIALVIVVIGLVIGIILFFKEQPNLAQQCLESAFSHAQELCGYATQQAGSNPLIPLG